MSAAALILLTSSMPGLSLAELGQVDSEILSLGRSGWIESFLKRNGDSVDARASAEKEFCIALGRQIPKLIADHPDRRFLGDLHTKILNITKGSVRISDYLVVGTGFERLFTMKAMSLGSLTMQRFITKQSATSQITQAQIWTQFRAARLVHLSNKDRIEAARLRSGGYTFAQHIAEFDGLGRQFERLYMATKTRPASEKQHLFQLSERMIALTLGKDPIPDLS